MLAVVQAYLFDPDGTPQDMEVLCVEAWQRVVLPGNPRRLNLRTFSAFKVRGNAGGKGKLRSADLRFRM